MIKVLTAVFSAGLIALGVSACDPRNLGSEDEVFGLLLVNNEGIPPSDFKRASKREIKARFEKNWHSKEPNMQLIETSIHSQHGRYIVNKSVNDFSGIKMRSESIFKVRKINEDGSLDISWVSGKICQVGPVEDQGKELLCSNVGFASGKAVVYLSKTHPDQIGFLTNYKTFGSPMTIKGKANKESYSGQSYWLFAGLLEAD